jgi:PKD repeat protein
MSTRAGSGTAGTAGSLGAASRRAPSLSPACALVVFLWMATCAASASAQLMVDFTAAPTAGVRPLDVVFTEGTSGAAITAWSWDFGDGLTSSLKNPTHTYVAPGSYSVTLTASSAEQSDSLTKTGFVVVEAGQFGPGRILAGSQSAVSIVTADVDGDGDLDVVAASDTDDRISWYSNTDGDGTFGPEQLISEFAAGASSVFVADLDGDGDLDVLSSSIDDSKIAWYENLDGLGTFGVQRLLMNDEQGAHSVYAADLDGDGDLDVVAVTSVTIGDKQPVTNSRVAWYANSDGLGNFGPQRVIANNAIVLNAVIAADLDGDGDQDVVTAAGLGGSGYIGWFENTNSLGSFAGRGFIAPPFTVLSPLSAFAADLDGDADLDILSASSSDDKIAWYENLEGTGNFGPQEIISADATFARSVFAVDMDNDGDLDVVSSSYQEVAWYANSDSHGSFSRQQVVSLPGEDHRWVTAADVDGDLFPDVLSARQTGCASKGNISWFANTDGMGTLGPRQLITGGEAGAHDAQLVVAADFNGDGSVDVLFGTDVGFCGLGGDLAIIPGTGVAGVFGAQLLVASEDVGLVSLSAPDLNGDGDPDILYSTDYPYDTVWYANLGGPAGFGPRQLIAIGAGWGGDSSADVDNDGDMDVITAASAQSTLRVSWYANTNGLGDFGSAQTITVDTADRIHVADLDSDGDADLLTGVYGTDTVQWYENTDALGAFGPAALITNAADGIIHLSSADIDGDGDLDVLTATVLGDSITWIENLDGAGLFGPPQVISSEAFGAYRVLATDLDGDGDQDLITAWVQLDTVAWFENKDGGGSFSAAQVLTTAAERVRDVFAADLDGDGDQDLLSASANDGKIAWYENTRLGPAWVDLGGASPGLMGPPLLTANGSHTTFPESQWYA